jgi:hypothetical protein
MRPRLIAAACAATAAAVVLVAPAASAAATDLLFSEYVEGSSNNKALELYNGTDAPVDLTAGGYLVQMYFNGATTAATTVTLAGTVAAGDVFVLAHASANATILAAADQTSAASFYNGDDAIVLRRGGADGPIVDVIGQIGTDPGTEWGTGTASTADNTLRRKSTVEAGDTEPADAFDPATQWDGFATDTVDGLGTHGGGTGPTDAPAVLTCGPALVTSYGIAATRAVTAADADDTITDLAVTAIVPTPTAGTVTRTGFTPATGPGTTATAQITASVDLAVGSYAVTVTATDDAGTTSTCQLPVQVTTVLTVGEVQGSTSDTENGPTDRSPLAPPSGNGTSSQLYEVQGVITQRTLARTSAGAAQYGFFLQSRNGRTDGDPTTSDGIFVFMGGFTSLIGGYVPTVGDEVVVRARVSEFFHLTQLSSASLVRIVDTGLDVDTVVTVSDAIPPADLAAAGRFWERLEGTRIKVRSGSGVVAGRDVFGGTADSEIWLVDRDDPILDRTDPYARRVFRDAHPLGAPADGNGQRIMLGTMGVKAAQNDIGALLPPARTFDTLTTDAVGGLYFSFEKYGVQAEDAAFTAGADPSANRPPRAANRSEEYAVATFNVENLYDYRDDPFDGCDFTGNAGCPGVSPPFDYVPADDAEYRAKLAALASQIVTDLHSPDVIMVEEAEDQDICTVASGALSCGGVNNADGAPDTLQELALAVAAAGGPAYATAYDRDGADARGIVSAFLFRTDRVALAPATADDDVLGNNPTVTYRAVGAASNADVQNPKALNADLPSDVDTSTGVDGTEVYTRAPQVGKFLVRAYPGSPETLTLWAIANHYSSTPNARIGQRREQAAYGAAIVAAITGAEPGARVVLGGDLNVFPRPDDPVTPASDQLGPLYQQGLRNLWDQLFADNPTGAYSYVFQGQAQTLDHLFVSPSLNADLVEVRAAHINADWPADHDADGARGTSDHDPQVARFRSRATLTVADVTVTEGNSGTTPATFTAVLSRPLSLPTTVCAATIGITAAQGSDYTGVSLCQAVPAGTTSVTFTVPVRGDRRREGTELFSLLVVGGPHLRLVDPLAFGTITDDD